MSSSPDAAPNPELARARLGALRESLLALHKTLIESERVGYEATFGVVQSPNQFFQLLVNDPWFAWLHPLSELVVMIDETMEETVTVRGAAQIFDQTRKLLKASEEGEGFSRSYFEALQREPDVVLAHADVMRQLNK